MTAAASFSFQSPVGQYLRIQLDELATSLELSAAECEQLEQQVSRYPNPSLMLFQLLDYNQQHDNELALLAESFVYGSLQTGEDFRHWVHSAEREKFQSIVDPADDLAPVLLERVGDELQITLNRPDARNAYSSHMRDALYEGLMLLELDSTIKHCTIKANGECFCTGGDLNEFGQFVDSAQSYRIRQQRNVARLLLKHASRIECRVHRVSIGSGIELPACAGRVVAAKKTFFQLPELSMGLIPGAGGTVSILRRIGKARLAWWVLSAKKINAQTALDWGLVDELV